MDGLASGVGLGVLVGEWMSALVGGVGGGGWWQTAQHACWAVCAPADWLTAWLID